MTVWHRFRNWRRSRPFWGGLLSVLAAGEIFLTLHVDLDGQEILIGFGGLQQNLILAVLIFCGLLAWFTPAQRYFYGLLVTFVAIYALIGVNIGGFILGTLLGVVGGGLMFAWNPLPGIDAVEAEQQDEEDDDDGAIADVDTLLDGPVKDTPPPAATPLRDGVPAQRAASDGDVQPLKNGPKHAAGTVIALALAVSLAILVGAQGSAGAAGAAGCATPTPTPSSTSTRGGDGGNIITDIIDFFGRLIKGGGGSTPAPVATPTPCPTPSKTGKPVPTPPSGTPTAGPTATPTGKPEPSSKPGRPSPSKGPSKVLPHVAGQPIVGERPSKMTGTRVTMIDLVYEGIVDLDTKDGGKIRVLWFTMARSDTNNFELYVYGDKARKQLDTSLRSNKLTVRGDRVNFYTSNFKGRLFGLLPVEYNPTSEPPPIPLPLVFFDDPVVDLVFVDSPVLEAPNLRINLVEPKW